MPKKSLPTGEEPPKGFESVKKTPCPDDGLRHDCVFISQLAKIEFAEIEAMRKLAFARIISYTGLTNEIIPFEREVSLLPGKEASDKLLFRAYGGKQLVGYALVVIGWPNTGDWVIQHLVIHPEYRLQGIGSAIVRKIEDFAHRSEVEAMNIFAIPMEESGAVFWQDLGYTTEAGRHPIKVADLDHELIVYRKEL